MSLPPGVAAAVSQGTVIEFQVINGITNRTYPGGCLSSASRGCPVKYSATALAVDVSGNADTRVAGILGQDNYDPTGIPSTVANVIYGSGVWTYDAIGVPVSVWKEGEFFLTNVHGSVSFGDYLEPYTGGLWVSTTTTNNLTNGAVVAQAGNAASGGAIVVFARLA
jgi:hypothetical protein